jgi:hypothetical protein
MGVPDHAAVSWTTEDQREHLVVVPVRARVKDHRRLSSIDIQINGDHLTVEQGLRQEKRGLVGHEVLPLYP